MSLNLDKTTWKRVTLGDVVAASKEKIDPASGEVERYIAGEHMDTDDLKIRRWGAVGDGYLGPAFHRRFHPGQVLYGSRRTYLRKVAVAEFGGVTANTTFVVETKDPSILLQEFLPFVMSSEPFHAFAIQESKGSVNPYVNWSDIERYEFGLPPLDKQKRLADLLWAIENHRRTVALETAQGDRVRQSFVDAFLDHASSKYRIDRLDALTTKISDGVHKRPEYTDSGVPFLTVENLTRGEGIDFTDVRYVSRPDHEEFIRRTHPERGDVLVSKDGTLGVARVIDTDIEFSIFVSIALLKPVRELILPDYLRSYFDSGHFKSMLAGKTSGSALKHIHLVDFRSTQVPLPPLDVQVRFVTQLGRLSASLEALAAETEALTSTKGALLIDIFGGTQ